MQEAKQCIGTELARAVRFMQMTHTMHLAGGILLGLAPPVTAWLWLACADEMGPALLIPGGVLAALGAALLVARSRLAVWMGAVLWALLTVGLAAPAVLFLLHMLHGGHDAWTAAVGAAVFLALAWSVVFFWARGVRPLLLRPDAEALRAARALVARARAAEAQQGEDILELHVCRTGSYIPWRLLLREGVAVLVCCSDRDVWAAAPGGMKVRELRTGWAGETEVLLDTPGRILRCRMAPEALAKLRAWQAAHVRSEDGAS